MAKLEARGIGKTIGETRILDDVDLTVEDGEFVVLVGPSGCGKSSLLRILCGLDQADSGTLAIDGRNMHNVPPAQRGLAMVFQSYALYPHMTVAENIGFGLKMAGLPAHEIAVKIQETAALLQLEPLLDRLPKALSGGQRQRVAIGRAIARKPGVLLFDEPLSNLDAALRNQMRVELKKLHQQTGGSIVYVTHDQVEAMTLADRIVVMNHGRVEQVGAPLDLYRTPVNLFVARFLGAPSINLIPARVIANKMLYLPLDGIPTLHATNLCHGDSVQIGIRPEHLRVKAQPEGQATVHTVEHLGDCSYVHASLPDGRDEPVSLVAKAGSHCPIKAGERITCQADLAHLLLFDPQGRRSEFA